MDNELKEYVTPILWNFIYVLHEAREKQSVCKLQRATKVADPTTLLRSINV